MEPAQGFSCRLSQCCARKICAPTVLTARRVLSQEDRSGQGMSGRAGEPDSCLTPGVLSAPGAAVPRGGADPSRAPAEVPGGAAQAAGAAARGAGDRRARAGAQHFDIPVKPGEAQCQKEEGEVQEKSVKAQRWPSNQFTFRYDFHPPVS